MKTGKASLLAWTLCTLAAVSALLQVGTSLARRATNPGAFSLGDAVLVGVVMPLFAAVAALIVSRQPRNLIGWLLMCPAIAMAIPAGSHVSGFATAPASPSPLLLLALWFANWNWLLLIMPILFIPLLFPTGRPLSKRWRWLAIAALSMCAFLIFFATFAEDLAPVTESPDGVWSVPNPIGFLPMDAFPMLAWSISLGTVALVSAASLAVRYRRAPAVERAQIKWLLYACVVFVVIYVPGVVLTGLETTVADAWNVLFPISLMAIPIAIAIAILRYRLWDIDLIIRRTLVYVPLTAILAGVFAASMKVSQALFSALVGATSEASTVLTTLVVVAVFEPIKKWLQRIVDTRFKEVSNPEQRWNAFGQGVRTFVEMSDPVAIVKRFLEEAVAVFEAKGGAAYLESSGEMHPIHTIGDWGNLDHIVIPLEHQGSFLGQLSLGVRRSGRPFDALDRESLKQTADAVAAAIALSGRKPPRG